MATLKELKPEIFEKFQQSDYLVGYHLGAVKKALESDFGEGVKRNILSISEEHGLSRLESTAYYFSYGIQSLAPEALKDTPKFEFDTLDSLYAQILENENPELGISAEFKANVKGILAIIEGLSHTVH